MSLQKTYVTKGLAELETRAKASGELQGYWAAEWRYGTGLAKSITVTVYKEKPCQRKIRSAGKR